MVDWVPCAARESGESVRAENRNRDAEAIKFCWRNLDKQPDDNFIRAENYYTNSVHSKMGRALIPSIRGPFLRT